MPEIGLPELLIVLVLVILFFGPDRIAKGLGDLGKGLRSFKDGFSDELKAEPKQETKSTDAK